MFFKNDLSHHEKAKLRILTLSSRVKHHRRRSSQLSNGMVCLSHALWVPKGELRVN
jgi:hypothetical protein